MRDASDPVKAVYPPGRRAVASRLAGRPWAIAPARLDGLLGGIGALSMDAAPPAWLSDLTSRQSYTVTEAGIAVVPVLGPLVARGDWLTALLGATEYAAVAGALAEAADDPAVRGVLLEVDSPGGEVGGLFDLVETLRSIRAQSGKPLWAVASEGALSAAYAIASAADRILVTRTAEVGSVGVVAVHVDVSAADAMAGLAWTLIHGGARKTDGNPHAPLSPQAAADIQADVDSLYTELVAMVARNRGMSPDSVRASEAGIFRGASAVETGFADGIGTVAEALAGLASLGARPIRPHRPTASLQAKGAALMTTPVPDAEEPDGCELIAAATAAVSATPLRSAVDEAAVAARLRAEFAEIATVAAQAGRLGIDIDAADAMRKGLRPDALRQSILDQLAARSEAADIVAAAPPPAATGDSPIVRRARERAAASR